MLIFCFLLHYGAVQSQKLKKKIHFVRSYGQCCSLPLMLLSLVQLLLSCVKHRKIQLYGIFKLQRVAV